MGIIRREIRIKGYCLLFNANHIYCFSSTKKNKKIIEKTEIISEKTSIIPEKTLNGLEVEDLNSKNFKSMIEEMKTKRYIYNETQQKMSEIDLSPKELKTPDPKSSRINKKIVFIFFLFANKIFFSLLWNQ